MRLQHDGCESFLSSLAAKAGFFLFSLQSDAPGQRELNEISLAIKTRKGIVLVVGCSHPGIERIVETATKIDPKIYSVFGGFHLSDTSDKEAT